MVKINEQYFVEVDKKNLTLVESTGKVRKSTGEPVYLTLGYYTSWVGIYKALYRLFLCEKIIKQDIVTMAELKNIFIESRQEIHRILADYL